MAKTWDDVKTFDDILFPEEVKIIREIEAKNLPKCPYSRKSGKSWYYCGVDLPENLDEKPGPSNPIYARHAGVLELQLWCMGEFDRCNYKSGKEKHDYPPRAHMSHPSPLI